jgi:hypothetical protein
MHSFSVISDFIDVCEAIGGIIEIPDPSIVHNSIEAFGIDCISCHCHYKFVIHSISEFVMDESSFAEYAFNTRLSRANGG